MKCVGGSLTLYGWAEGGGPVTRHSRSLNDATVALIAIVGYALLCGMLYLR
jgi:hypothetical protein